MTEPTSIILTGTAYQRRATLEIRGDSLMWRALRGQVYSAPENIATSVHDVKNVMWVAYGHFAFGATAFGLAVLIIAWRATHPARFLGLELGGRWFVLRVDHTSADEARTLVGRIERRLLTGESPERPPVLP